MNAKANKVAFRLGMLALAASVSALLNACKSAQSQQSPIKIDGSSTVFPITQAIAQEFQSTKEGKSVKVEVAFSGTSGGFRKFCAGETDIANASRPILAEEMAACSKAGVRYIELPVAYDALTVAVHPQNNWAKDITVAELKKMWEPAAQEKITKWNQIRSTWPDRPLKLYGAGKDSGTFDYFTEATVGQARASRTDYIASEDDNVLVRGIAADPNALGYFGFAYYEANQNKLKALAINSGKGIVLPSRQTVEKAQYQPLSRPLLIYVNFQSAQKKPEVQAFVEFYLQNAKRLTSRVGYIPLPTEGYHLSSVHFERGKAGTVFGGKSELNLTIGELLRKEAKF
ncbi:MAG TPA: PstS family phosphate ABC transporter substrate-binding protein [Leptolyngbyaceae cyanobacterium]